MAGVASGGFSPAVGTQTMPRLAVYSIPLADILEGDGSDAGRSAGCDRYQEDCRLMWRR